MLRCLWSNALSPCFCLMFLLMLFFLALSLVYFFPVTSSHQEEMLFPSTLHSEELRHQGNATKSVA